MVIGIAADRHSSEIGVTSIQVLAGTLSNVIHAAALILETLRSFRSEQFPAGFFSADDALVVSI